MLRRDESGSGADTQPESKCGKSAVCKRLVIGKTQWLVREDREGNECKD